jgi:hypothetical protein
MWFPWLVLLSSLLTSGTPSPAAAPAAIVYDQSPEQWMLDGIELGDDAFQVIEVWGRPNEVIVDDWQSGCETWNYKEGKNLGMCNERVYFVQVTAKAQNTSLDGQAISMETTKLRQALGNPEFLADDGWGVLRGNEALKVFVDEQGSLVSIDLFTGPDNG